MSSEVSGSPMQIAEFMGSGSGVDGATALGGGTLTGAHAGRRDGRGALEMRPLRLVQGVLHNADGSARVRAGGSEVLAAVYGPTECALSRQDPERCSVGVQFRHRSAEEGGEMAAVAALRALVSSVVLTALNPRKMLAVTVHVLAQDGGVGAAAVNAVALALLDAGVPLSGVPVAASVSISSGAIIVDPNAAEEAEASGVLTFTFCGGSGLSDDYAAVNTLGDCGGADLFATASDAAHSLAKQTLAFIRLSIDRKQEMPRAY